MFFVVLHYTEYVEYSTQSYSCQKIIINLNSIMSGVMINYVFSGEESFQSTRWEVLTSAVVGASLVQTKGTVGKK